MKFFVPLLLLVLMAPVSAGREYVILSGGPALRQWEKTKQFPHDRVWDNFIFTAGLRIAQIKERGLAEGDRITWLIPRLSYETRGREDGKDYIAIIEQRAAENGVNLVWIYRNDMEQQEIIDYLNSGQDRNTLKVGAFDFFGHSNKSCFMIDYSNDLDGVSSIFLHKEHLKKIKPEVFAPDATAWSGGCYSGDGFIQAWKKATGVRMVGTKNKTSYETRSWPFPSKDGYWEE
ncbi:MAG: hypothetical protein SFY92_01470 [Verrucomicrobiae bacterium]|nr:hypothetical protein [Verrucomicrobiae bacterium]